MKTKIWINFCAENIPGEAATILVPAGCGADVAKVNDYTIYANLRDIRVDIELDAGDNRIAKVLVLLEEYGVPFKSATYIEYSEEDRQNAPLLWMTRDIDENVSAGLRYGTKYDRTNACTKCYAGAQQTSELYVDGDALPKIRKHRAIGTYKGDVLVDGGMVKKLKDAGLTGISFGDVRARMRNEKWQMVARDQIIVEHTMPPMRSELTDKDKEYLCPVCRRGGRRDFPLRPYRAEDLEGKRDFNLTWEWFGDYWPANEERQRLEKWPHPHLLVTPKVMNIFRDAGVTTFEWRPVLVDE